MNKITNYIKKNKKELIYFITCILLFITLSILVITKTTTYIDTFIHSWILDIRNNNLTKLLSIITKLVDASFLLALSSILFIILKNKKTSLYILVNLVCSFILNETFKSIFLRTRPVGINLIEASGYSYPSGHSMVALSFYSFIGYLLYKKYNNKNIKTLIIVSTISLILVVGFSRIYLGVHYLTDVIAGFVLASIYLPLYIKLIKLEKK